MFRPVSWQGPVELTHKTEKVSIAFDPEENRFMAKAYSINTKKTRDLPALSALADESPDLAEKWVRSRGSTIRW